MTALGDRLAEFFTGDVKTVLDLGCGTMQHTRPYIEGRFVVGIDAYPGYCAPCAEAGASHFFWQNLDGTGAQYPWWSPPWDLVLCLDVLEHMDKGDAEQVLMDFDEMRATGRAKQVVLFTTDGFKEQDANDSLGHGMNPYQKHKCGFTKPELEAYGFTVQKWGESKNDYGLLAYFK